MVRVRGLPRLAHGTSPEPGPDLPAYQPPRRPVPASMSISVGKETRTLIKDIDRNTGFV